MRVLAGALAACLFVVAPARAAGEVDVAAGPGVATSGGDDWSGDGAIPSGALRLAYRFPVGVGPVFVGREGYAKVDQRLLTLVSLGAQAWLVLDGVKPYARVAWAHQHEESWAFAKEEPFGVLFGVGRGIRHRGGLDFGVGADVPVAGSERLRWFLFGEAWLDWLFASEAPGPAYYAGGSVGVGLDWAP